LGFHEILFYFVFVAWLDAALLQYMIASILKGCEGIAIVISTVLVLVLMAYVNPVQLWLCGWVGCSISTVGELWPRSLSHWIIRHTGGSSSSKLHQFSKSARFWKGLRRLQFTSVQCWW
jgi:hypothetical protein